MVACLESLGFGVVCIPFFFLLVLLAFVQAFSFLVTGGSASIGRLLRRGPGC